MAPRVPRTPRSPRSGGSAFWSEVDLIAAAVLMSLFGFLAGVLVIYGKFVALQADPCGTPGYRCDLPVIDAATAVASLLPAVLFLTALVAAVVQRRRHGLVFPIPALGIGAACAVFVAANLVAQAAVTDPG